MFSSVLRIKTDFSLKIDPLTEYTKAIALFTMRRYNANTETQENAQNLENKFVELDYTARIPALINVTFRRWEWNFSINFFLCGSY
jgi:hypothetical protein